MTVSKVGHLVTLAAAAALGIIATSGAGAQQPLTHMPSPQQQSENAWKRMDNCRREAWRQYPDFTPDSNAKRDQATRRCLNEGNLPPLAPQSPTVGSGSSRQ